MCSWVLEIARDFDTLIFLKVAFHCAQPWKEKRMETAAEERDTALSKKRIIYLKLGHWLPQKIFNACSPCQNQM